MSAAWKCNRCGHENPIPDTASSTGATCAKCGLVVDWDPPPVGSVDHTARIASALESMLALMKESAAAEALGAAAAEALGAAAAIGANDGARQRETYKAWSRIVAEWSKMLEEEVERTSAIYLLRQLLEPVK